MLSICYLYDMKKALHVIQIQADSPHCPISFSWFWFCLCTTQNGRERQRYALKVTLCQFILCISIHYVYMQGSVLCTLLYALCMCLCAPDYMHLCVLVCMCVKVRQGCYAGVKWTPLWQPSACWHWRQKGTRLASITQRERCVCACPLQIFFSLKLIN